jgi:hypothetical protein
VLPTGNESFLVAVCFSHTAEVRQSIRKPMAIGHQEAFGPITDRFWTEAAHGGGLLAIREVKLICTH